MISEVKKISEYTALLDQLPGVLSTNIVGGNGMIAEIHILSDLNRSPKQIVRDVQSALSAKYGLNIDHKVISVAQIPMENIQGIAQNRLVFEELSLTKRQNVAVAKVTLTYNGATRFAQGETGHYSDEISRMVCELTLQAVEEFFPEEMRFTLMDFKLHDLAGEQVVTVCVGLRRGGVLERYVGCALAAEDQNLAVVRAVLNALNRRLSIELK